VGCACRYTTPSCAQALSGFYTYPGEAIGPPVVVGLVPQATSLESVRCGESCVFWLCVSKV